MCICVRVFINEYNFIFQLTEFRVGSKIISQLNYVTIKIVNGFFHRELFQLYNGVENNPDLLLTPNVPHER